MATIDLGKIKQVFRGTYNNSTAYVPDDLVVFTDGSVTSTYICTTASTGNNPSSGGTAHANWSFIAKGQATSPTTTRGDLIVRGASADERLAIGTAGQALKVNGAANGFEFGTAGGIVVAGIVTANSFSGSFTGDGSALTGVSAAEVYGFTGIGSNLQIRTTNKGADNITGDQYAAFEQVMFAPSGITFSINSSGNLIATI